MGPCIYCVNPADSKEHWLPRTLGAIRGADTLIDRLCETCNRELGRELDEEFARTGLTGFFRTAHGIQGRSGHSPVNPFLYRAMAAEQPTTMMMPSPTGAHQVLGEVVPDPVRGHVARQIRQLVFRKADGSIACVPFPRAWKSEQLKTAVRERNLEGAEVIELYLDEDETPDSMEVKRTLTEAVGRFGQVPCWYGGYEEGSVKQVGLASGISLRYLRALAKVALHYFLWSNCLYRGNEDEFLAVRQFIRRGEGDWQAFVRPTAPPFVPQLRDYIPTKISHFLSADLDVREAIVGLHFFVGPTEMPPASIVRLGPSPSRIHARSLTAHWVRYYDQKTDGYDGEIETVDVTSRRIIVPRFR